MDEEQGVTAGEAGRAGEGVFAGGVFSQCPYCDYALAGLRENRCPECGTEITEADARLDARRRVFLELTRYRVFGWTSFVLVLCMVPPAWLVLIPFGLGVLGAWVLPGGWPAGLERRVRRRVWLVSLPWFWLPLLGLLVIPTVVLSVSMARPDFGFLSDIVYSILDFLGLAGFGTVQLLVYLVSILLWRRRLVRLGRAAGLERGAGHEPFPWKCASTRLAVFPVLVVLVAWVVISVSIAAIDWWRPNWGTGW